MKKKKAVRKVGIEGQILNLVKSNYKTLQLTLNQMMRLYMLFLWAHTKCLFFNTYLTHHCKSIQCNEAR